MGEKGVRYLFSRRTLIGRGHGGVTPFSWNMYAYVRNNPTNLTDPTGMGGCNYGPGGICNDRGERGRNGEGAKWCQEPF